MKVVNLNRFKNQQAVELDGTRYSVKGVTVDMYLNDPDLAKLDALGDDQAKERVATLVSILGKISTIPTDVLTKQPMAVLFALMQVAQGNDPTESLGPEGNTEDVPGAGSPNA